MKNDYLGIIGWRVADAAMGMNNCRPTASRVATAYVGNKCTDRSNVKQLMANSKRLNLRPKRSVFLQLFVYHFSNFLLYLKSIEKLLARCFSGVRGAVFYDHAHIVLRVAHFVAKNGPHRLPTGIEVHGPLEFS